MYSVKIAQRCGQDLESDARAEVRKKDASRNTRTPIPGHCVEVALRVRVRVCAFRFGHFGRPSSAAFPNGKIATANAELGKFSTGSASCDLAHCTVRSCPGSSVCSLLCCKKIRAGVFPWRIQTSTQHTK